MLKKYGRIKNKAVIKVSRHKTYTLTRIVQNNYTKKFCEKNIKYIYGSLC